MSQRQTLHESEGDAQCNRTCKNSHSTPEPLSPRNESSTAKQLQTAHACKYKEPHYTIEANRYRRKSKKEAQQRSQRSQHHRTEENGS
ncbi:hypothetical protein EAS61_36955 [Bradyrhizobium zhanjiangense]|uniref:Uncharacterized protein n=1 Tax=Bradyrhizobium zhanjiangense TaxID=1325107 RepID=A0A4Q0Q799_9BRAD|nr:hypothetical protein EAS61_36955 [Bradyrhizobium zhanjiangense]